MRSSAARQLIVVGAILSMPVTGYAQEAAVRGTVTDSTGGVLPGVTVTAVHEASGNTFVTVTDGQGAYRLPVRTEGHRITAELPGFATVTRSVELLVGQQAVVNLQMQPATVAESVTVTGEAPLLDTTQSSLGGNIDPRQMQELPVNGRNWITLSVLAPGSRGNAMGGTGDDPLPRSVGTYQLNVDGQQVTQLVALSFGQPRYSRDAIGEFEFIANRFAATQGRSSGIQVNAITKSGTNTPSGTFSGYFRDDRFNAADFVAKRVVPYSNQQVGGTFGGPIRRDKVHAFGYYEYEREPRTFIYSTPFPSFNQDITDTRTEHKGGVRLDFQFSSKTRLMVRGNKSSNLQPHDPRFTGGATRTPSSTESIDVWSNELYTTLTTVLGNRAVNEVKVGYGGFKWLQDPTATFPGAPNGRNNGAPQIQLRGFIIGQAHIAAPEDIGQETYSVRDDFTYSFTKGGRHDLKVGGEYLYNLSWLFFCNNCNGILDAQGGPIPANIEELFPNITDVSTWNLAALSPITRKYVQGVGDFTFNNPRHVYAAWAQDDWAVTRRLTLNLGVRYDLAFGVWGEYVSLPPFMAPNRPAEKNRISPRLGFALSLTDRTVLRGGFGKYFQEVTDQPALWAVAWTQQAHPQVLNDGRPDFAANPFNGPAPTYDEVVRSGVVRAITSQLAGTGNQIPYSYQTSIGVQRQLGNTMAVEADYAFNAIRHDLAPRNANLTYNPATGANYPFTDASKRPYPEWGVVNMSLTQGRSDYHALQAAFTKRLSQRWQASATYTLSGLWDEDPPPVNTFAGCTHPLTAPGVCNVPIKLAPDLGGEWTLATTDQRHRAVVNGIWQLGYGFQVSGLYFFGSGERFATFYGGELRNTGLGSTGRLRPNGTIVPRNNFVGKPIHRVDLRVQRRFPLVGRAGVDAIAEVFNLFNHANFGAYSTAESLRNFGQPSALQNLSYFPRMLQLGFRFAF